MTHLGFHSWCQRASVLDVARHCGVTLVGRAKHDRFLVFNGGERIAFDR